MVKGLHNRTCGLPAWLFLPLKEMEASKLQKEERGAGEPCWGWGLRPALPRTVLVPLSKRLRPATAGVLTAWVGRTRAARAAEDCEEGNSHSRTGMKPAVTGVATAGVAPAGVAGAVEIVGQAAGQRNLCSF